MTPLAAGLIFIDYAGQGPVILRFSDQHGVHAADLVVVALWLALVGSLLGINSLLRRREQAGMDQLPRRIHFRAKDGPRRAWTRHASTRRSQHSLDSLAGSDQAPTRSSLGPRASS